MRTVHRGDRGHLPDADPSLYIPFQFDLATLKLGNFVCPSFGRLRHGVTIDETTAEYYGLPDTDGVVVSEVNPGGPADEAGLETGDIIREVDGYKIEDNLDLIARISSHQPGDKVRLKVFRDRKEVSLTATLGDHVWPASTEAV